VPETSTTSPSIKDLLHAGTVILSVTLGQLSRTISRLISEKATVAGDVIGTGDRDEKISDFLSLVFF